MKTVMTSTLKSTSLDGVVAAVESSSTIQLRSDESAIPTPSDVVAVVTTDRIATGGGGWITHKGEEEEFVDGNTRNIHAGVWWICH